MWRSLCPLKFFEKCRLFPAQQALCFVNVSESVFPELAGWNLWKTHLREVRCMAYDVRISLFKLCNNQLSPTKSRMWFPLFLVRGWDCLHAG